MIDVSIGYILYLHNYIPITIEDTRRGSTATTLRRAAERTKAETNAAQAKCGRNGLWCMANLNRKEVRTVQRSYKNESRQTAATVWRHAALRKTQTPSATSLTEGPPKRKFFFSEFETRRIS